MSPEARKKHNQEKIEELHESYRPMVREFLHAAEDAGYVLRITEGFRSFERQNELYAQGRTTDGNRVTNAKGGQSFHNFGLAIDVHDEEDGYEINWEKLGEIAAKIGIEHGDRGHTDLPHFQYRGDLSLEEVQKGKRPEKLDKYNELTMSEYEELKEDIKKIHKILEQLDEKIEKNRTRKYGKKRINKRFKKFRKRFL